VQSSACTAMPVGAYVERVLEVLQHTFAPMYERVWRGNWNNGVFACVRRPYYHVSFQDGIYEVYIPVALDGENVMHYWRVAVKVHGELDREAVRREQRGLEIPWVKPVGVVDSETICHIAQKPSEELRQRLKKDGRKALLRGFRHVNKPGYLTLVIVDRVPEIAAKRLIANLLNFLDKRIRQLLVKLNLQPWMFEEALRNRGVNSLIILLEKFSETIRTIAKNMLETFYWLADRLKDLYAEIGRQNMLLTKLRPIIREIRDVLSVCKRPNVFRNSSIPDPPIIRELEWVVFAYHEMGG